LLTVVPVKKSETGEHIAELVQSAGAVEHTERKGHCSHFGCRGEHEEALGDRLDVLHRTRNQPGRLSCADGGDSSSGRHEGGQENIEVFSQLTKGGSCSAGAAEGSRRADQETQDRQ